MVDAEIAELLAGRAGQVLTSLPGVATVWAAAFACHSPPIKRFASAEHLYSGTGLAPASYESASVCRRGAMSRQRLAEHRDALMAIAWRLSQFSASFRERDRALRARGFQPIQARVALARHACRLGPRLIGTRQPFDEEPYRRARHSTGGDGVSRYAARRRNVACRPPALAALTAQTKGCDSMPDQPADSAADQSRAAR